MIETTETSCQLLFLLPRQLPSQTVWWPGHQNFRSEIFRLMPTMHHEPAIAVRNDIRQLEPAVLLALSIYILLAVRNDIRKKAAKNSHHQLYQVLLQYYNLLLRTIQSTTPVLLRTTKDYTSTTSKDYTVLLQRTTPVLLRTTKYYSSTTPYCKVQSTTPLLLRATKYYSSTTQYYSNTTKYYSALHRTRPVLLRTTQYYKILLHYYSVLQSTTPVLLSTTPLLLRTTQDYASTTPYYKALLQYYAVLQSTNSTTTPHHEKYHLTFTKYCACYEK